MLILDFDWFVCFDSYVPVNNFSVMPERVSWVEPVLSNG